MLLGAYASLEFFLCAIDPVCVCWLDFSVLDDLFYIKLSYHATLQAASFGGSNIDPTAWEDKKCKGESRFPAQVNGHCFVNCLFVKFNR